MHVDRANYFKLHISLYHALKQIECVTLPRMPNTMKCVFAAGELLPTYRNNTIGKRNAVHVSITLFFLPSGSLWLTRYPKWQPCHENGMFGIAIKILFDFDFTSHGSRLLWLALKDVILVVHKRSIGIDVEVGG